MQIHYNPSGNPYARRRTRDFIQFTMSSTFSKSSASQPQGLLEGQGDVIRILGRVDL